MIGIREARLEDGPALAAIDTATWSPDVTPTPPRDPGAPFFDERADPADVLVAESDGAGVGYVALRQSIPLPSHRHVLEINGLAVDPAHRRRGVGRRLVEAAKDEARRRGARKLSLRVLSPNVSARNLYASCGFVVEGILEDEFLLDGELVDDVLMACRLRD